MIRRFGLRNFKGHRDTELELGRLTLLVGDNASGKTSVLEALLFQAEVAEDPVWMLDQAALLRDWQRRQSSSGVISMHTDGEISPADRGLPPAPPAPWTTRIELSVDEPPPYSASPPRGHARLTGLNEQPQLRGLHVQRPLSAEASWDFSNAIPQAWGAPGWDSIAELFGVTKLFRLDAAAIAAAAYSDAAVVPIETDGTNTAVALAAMKLADDDAFQRIERDLRQIVPSVERVRLNRVKVQHPTAEAEVIGNKLAFDFRGALGVPAEGASRGTLIVLALLTLLHRSNRPDLILLDDFDHALHPRAQMELVRMLKRLLAIEDFRDVQIVATTHSPYVLDQLDPSDIYAFALREDGTVASKRLSEHPDAEKTRGSLKAGQLWSLDPEQDWVLKG